MFRRDDDPVLPIRIIGAVSLFLIFGIFSEMLSGGAKELAAYNIGDIYKLSSEGRNGGGIFAGSLSYAMFHNIGVFGEVLITLLALILSLFAINRQFFSQFFRNLFIGAGEKTGEIISSSREKNEARRQRIEERKRLPELPDNGEAGTEGDQGEAADDLPAREEKPTVRDKIRKEREEKKADEESKKNKPLKVPLPGNFGTESFRQKSEDSRIRKEQEKKVRSETDDAKKILDVRKAPDHGSAFEPKHTGEMHQMSYVEDDPDDYIPEEPEYNEALGGWDNPSKRPGSSRNAEPEDTDEEQYYEQDGYYDEPDGSYIPDEVKIDVKSEHAIKVSDHSIPDEISGEDSEETEPEEVPAGKPEADIPASRPAAAVKADTPAASRSGASGKNKKFRYDPPKLDFLVSGSKGKNDGSSDFEDVQRTLVSTLSSFGVEAEIIGHSQGPTVTRYEFKVSQGTKLSRVVGLSDELKMALAATDIRIEAPIPGKSAIGIEVPNSTAVAVKLRDLLESREYKNSKDTLPFAVGKDIEGQTIVANIAKFPHVLIAGTTGSGKSVCINTLILSILYKSSPEDVQLIMVDPKVVELKVYNGIPHLPFNVVTKPKAASEMLKWCVLEMERRYRLFADREVRDIEGYNQYVLDVNEGRRDPMPSDQYEESDSMHPALRKLPRIVIIIDELADLMMVAAKEVEESICRLAQLARAAGMHLVVATQRPSVDVITGLIKANMPSRIAFAVSSGVDSRTILDTVGAEKLLGKGDMLFYPQGKMKPDRLQGAFVSDEEVSKVTGYLKGVSNDPSFRNPLSDADRIDDLKKTIKDIEAGMDPTPSSSGGSSSGSSQGSSVFGDDLFAECGLAVIRSQKASIGYLQRVHKIGFNRAARIMDYLAEYGVVGPEQGTKPREILMTEDQFNVLLKSKDTPPE
ncbi:MAG: DNA translocase FtsK [Lachnospiraceae bacterium]|nr:DNA translocase FtsK [Lachnospiraceae bacterium]